MSQRLYLLFTETVCDIGHRRYAAADTRIGLVVMQRLNQVVLPLAGKTRNRFRSGKGVGMA